jgi:hypothetical protein
LTVFRATDRIGARRHRGIADDERERSCGRSCTRPVCACAGRPASRAKTPTNADADDETMKKRMT